MRLIIRLKEKDAFDSVILDYLKDKSNKGGHIKKIVYDYLSVKNGIDNIHKPVATHNSSYDSPGKGDPINDKLDKLADM
jgi:hypothetical protein